MSNDCLHTVLGRQVPKLYECIFGRAYEKPRCGIGGCGGRRGGIFREETNIRNLISMAPQPESLLSTKT